MRVLQTLCLLVGTVFVAEGSLWTIAVGNDWSGNEYIDSNGFLAGFHYDLIAEVCSAARIECRTMWIPYNQCWKSEAGQLSFAGKGLISGWFDACTGWTGTTNRLQVFDFSMTFAQPVKGHFYKKKGASFDPKDITGKNIGFIDGFFTDDKCLARQSLKGVPIPKDRIFHYKSNEAIIQAMIDNKLDAVFTAEKHLYHDDIEELPEAYICSSSGQSMMTRKDNDFNEHWNSGFQQIVANGRFRRLCAEAINTHGHKGELNQCV